MCGVSSVACAVVAIVMMEQDDFNMLSQESGDDPESTLGTTTNDDASVHLPAYLSYLSLCFRIISTMIVVPMAGWIIITIRTTRSLHKVHNIYVAYLMAIDAIVAFSNTLLSSVMMIGYFTDVGDFIGCNVYMFMLYPTNYNNILDILGNFS